VFAQRRQSIERRSLFENDLAAGRSVHHHFARGRLDAGDAHSLTAHVAHDVQKPVGCHGQGRAGHAPMTAFALLFSKSGSFIRAEHPTGSMERAVNSTLQDVQECSRIFFILLM